MLVRVFYGAAFAHACLVDWLAIESRDEGYYVVKRSGGGPITLARVVHGSFLSSAMRRRSAETSFATIMCNVKKLCTCEAVRDGQDYWRLEFHCGQFPSWGQVIPTRPEHREIAESMAKNFPSLLGPMPMPRFKKLFVGLADPSQMRQAVEAEVAWLNAGNPFDFDYEPFQGDRLMFVIGGQEIAFSFLEGRWVHKPHQAYSVDDRMGIDAEAEDLAAREKAKKYLDAAREKARKYLESDYP